jgi:glutamate dehydrogenase/leucine dehydrogenase
MPGVLSIMVPDGFEQVVHGHDPATGLQAIIALHSTVLGPGLGGTRFWPFATRRTPSWTSAGWPGG